MVDVTPYDFQIIFYNAPLKRIIFFSQCEDEALYFDAIFDVTQKTIYNIT